MVRILIIKLKYALLNFREMSETPKVNIFYSLAIKKILVTLFTIA